MSSFKVKAEPAGISSSADKRELPPTCDEVDAKAKQMGLPRNDPAVQGALATPDMNTKGASKMTGAPKQAQSPSFPDGMPYPAVTAPQRPFTLKK
jgi:hypothetical protein